MKTDKIVIAAATSGSGKTTLTRGILRLLHDAGLRVQPFKCGPDYLDPFHHQVACGCPSINLDVWMTSPQQVCETFRHYASMADVSVVEGVMGLYDGADGMQGSTAQVAELIDAPVVLVVNARSMAHSIAPLLYGYLHYRPQTPLAGVIFNNVGSQHHRDILCQAAAQVGMPVLGCVPRLPALQVESRYLGLHAPAADAPAPGANPITADMLPGLMQLLQLDSSTHPADATPSIPVDAQAPHIWVAHDEAFNFLYPETLRLLRQHAHVHLFSPLNDEPVAPDASLIYLPGGYPELYADRLSRSTATMQSLRDVQAPILAECGGMMYLAADIDGTPMTGLLPLHVTMQDARLHLGYRSARYHGHELRGHEFHYSTITADCPPSALQQYDARGEAVATGTYLTPRIFASYTHWSPPSILAIVSELMG